MPGKPALHKKAAGFIDTMDCLPVSRLPEGPEWTYEIKLDGYRLEAVRTGRRTTLYSRRQNVLNQNFRSAESRIVYYVFDILIHKQHNLTELPLSERRAILSSVIEPGEHVALS